MFPSGKPGDIFQSVNPPPVRPRSPPEILHRFDQRHHPRTHSCSLSLVVIAISIVQCRVSSEINHPKQQILPPPGEPLSLMQDSRCNLRSYRPSASLWVDPPPRLSPAANYGLHPLIIFAFHGSRSRLLLSRTLPRSVDTVNVRSPIVSGRAVKSRWWRCSWRRDSASRLRTNPAKPITLAAETARGALSIRIPQAAQAPLLP